MRLPGAMEREEVVIHSQARGPSTNEIRVMCPTWQPFPGPVLR